jgi:hypothetical protein
MSMCGTTRLPFRLIVLRRINVDRSLIRAASLGAFCEDFIAGEDNSHTNVTTRFGERG